MARSSISFEYDDSGKTRKGTYFISGGELPLLTVSTEFGKKATQLGKLPPDVLAKQMAGELIVGTKIRR